MTVAIVMLALCFVEGDWLLASDDSVTEQTALVGTVTTDEGTHPPFPPFAIRIAAIPVGDNASGSPASEPVATNWTFRFSAVTVPHLIRVTGLPGEWRLKSVRLSGRDLTDTPFEPSGGPETIGLEILLTRSSATVSGDVVDAHGAPAPDTTVVVFPADRAKWGIASRYIKSVRSDGEANFTVNGLPPETYLLVAKEFVADGSDVDAAFLERASAAATRLTLFVGATSGVSLKVED